MRIFINDNAHRPEEEDITPMPIVNEPQLDLLLEGGAMKKQARVYTPLDTALNKVRILRHAMRDIAEISNDDGNGKIAALKSLARATLQATGD